MPSTAAMAWGAAHQDAHDALVAMGIPSKEAKELLKGLSGVDSGDIATQALRLRGRQNKRVTAPSGAPAGAVPLNPPSATQSAAKAAVNQPAAAAKPKTKGPVPEPAIPAAMRLKMPPPDWNAILGRPKPQPAAPPPAPITPPQGAEQPPQQQLPGKPRYRVPLVSYPTPAPIAGAPSAPVAEAQPTAQPQPQAPPQLPGQAPEINSMEDYNKLAPGTLFRWTGEGAHRGRLFRAHVNPQAGRQQVFGKAPQ
jgi:hypothetical protein